MQDKIDYVGCVLNIDLDGEWLFACKSTPGANTNHCETTNSVTFPVQAGQKLTIRGDNVSPNGARNELMIQLWRF